MGRGIAYSNNMRIWDHNAILPQEVPEKVEVFEKANFDDVIVDLSIPQPFR